MVGSLGHVHCSAKSSRRSTTCEVYSFKLKHNIILPHT